MAIAHSRTGTGEPLVLIHGLGGSRRIWNPVIDRVAAERDVVAVDLPGFGDSPPLPDGIPPTAANLGAAVGELCVDLGLKRPHLAGNSLGAWAALELAKAGDVASVCAISPAGLWRRPLGPRRVDSHAWALRLRPLMPLLLASPRLRTRFLRATVTRPERLTGAESTALVRDWLDAPAYEAANVEMRSHVFEHPELVTVPTTVAWGTEDGLVGRPKRERMPPGARYVELEGLGHTPTWDDPPRIADLLLESSSSAQVSSGRSSPGQAPVAR
jgi:pimeloyl-ACP methyl ester carboxylesterase